MMRFQNEYIHIFFLSFFHKHIFHKKHEYFRDAIFFFFTRRYTLFEQKYAQSCKRLFLEAPYKSGIAKDTRGQKILECTVNAFVIVRVS